MATLTQHIYAIRNLISRGASSDDSRITNSLIQHSLNVGRATLLKRRMDKFDDIAHTNYQKICVTLEDSNPNECSLPFTLPDECIIRKSTVKIPQSVSARWGSPTRVSTPGGNRLGKLDLSASFDAKYSLTRPDLKASYFFQENYLYVIGDKILKQIVLWDIYNDPTEADGVSTCANNTESWPLDPDLILMLYQLTLEIMGISFKFPEDTMNDASDVIPPPAKK